MTKVYVETVLEPIIRSLTDILFEEDCTFEQDSAPVHKSKLVQDWPEENVDTKIGHREVLI